jgi:hypothetical protein
VLNYELPKNYKKLNKKIEILKNILSGALIKDTLTFAHLKFSLFIIAMIIAIVANRYAAEKSYHHLQKLNTELKELKFQYTVSQKKLINFSRESQIVNDSTIKSLGLKLPENPPQRIYINKK